MALGLGQVRGAMRADSCRAGPVPVDAAQQQVARRARACLHIAMRPLPILISVLVHGRCLPSGVRGRWGPGAAARGPVSPDPPSSCCSPGARIPLTCMACSPRPTPVPATHVNALTPVYIYAYVHPHGSTALHAGCHGCSASSSSTLTILLYYSPAGLEHHAHTSRCPSAYTMHHVRRSSPLPL